VSRWAVEPTVERPDGARRTGEPGVRPPVEALGGGTALGGRGRPGAHERRRGPGKRRLNTCSDTPTWKPRAQPHPGPWTAPPRAVENPALSVDDRHTTVETRRIAKTQDVVVAR
jgi:hypothetical protein